MLFGIISDHIAYLAVLAIEMYGGYYVDQRQRFTLFLDCHRDLNQVFTLLPLHLTA